MTAQATSDAILDVKFICRHGIEFDRALEPYLPSVEPYLPGYDRRAPTMALPPRFEQIQVASPPPKRAGDLKLDWNEGIYLNDGSEFNPDKDGELLRQDIHHLEGIPSLDVPAPDTIILDKLLTVPFVHEVAAVRRRARDARDARTAVDARPARVPFGAIPAAQPWADRGQLPTDLHLQMDAENEEQLRHRGTEPGHHESVGRH
jgi:hypothetical protein